MGVLAPVSAERDTPLSPPSTSAEIFRRTCYPRLCGKSYWSRLSQTVFYILLVKVILDCVVNPTGPGYPRLRSKSYWSRLSQTA